jgi:hypothetical protein
MLDKKDKVVILVIPIAIFLFLFFTGTLNSGYHFVDDHEVIRMKDDLKSLSLTEVTKKWVREDLVSNNRFRPLYYIHRVFETDFFGSNFFLWSLYTGIQCCLAFIFFYLGIRNLKFSMGEAVLFLIIVFIGPQSSIWWRLGPSEGLAMVFFSLSFYFMSDCLRGKNYIIKNVLFIFFLILSSLCKESFVMIIPAIVFFKIWNEKINLCHTLKESIARNWILSLPVFILIIELGIIKYVVGTNASGPDSTLSSNIHNILSTVLHFFRTYLNLLVVGLIFLILSLYLKKPVKKPDLFPVVFFLLIFAPNILLYSKSGLSERYLLPSTIGLGFLVVSFVKGVEDNATEFKKLCLALVMVGFLPFLISTGSKAIKFSKEGRETKSLLAAITEYYDKGRRVMVVVDPVASYEISVSLKVYLNFENQIDLYGYPILKDENIESNKEFVEGWKSYFNDKLPENLSSKPGLLIFLDNTLIEKFFMKSKIVQNNYLPVEIGVSHFALLKENQVESR